MCILETAGSVKLGRTIMCNDHKPFYFSRVNFEKPRNLGTMIVRRLIDTTENKSVLL